MASRQKNEDGNFSQDHSLEAWFVPSSKKERSAPEHQVSKDRVMMINCAPLYPFC